MSNNIMTFTANKAKEIIITYNGTTKTLHFSILRAWKVCVEILKRWPNEMDIHEMDRMLSDPNRAASDLKIGDGYGQFLIEGKSKITKNNTYIFDVKKLFDTIKSSDIRIRKKERESIPQEMMAELDKVYHNKCNITGIELKDNIKKGEFLGNLQAKRYDHRVPVSRGGKTEIDNMQLLSDEANRQKNNICNTCPDINDCNYCALAFPEKQSKILALDDETSDISSLLKSNKQIKKYKIDDDDETPMMAAEP